MTFVMKELESKGLSRFCP